MHCLYEVHPTKTSFYLISRTSLVMQTTLILKRREFKISNFDDQTVSVGIHDVAFKDDLNATLKS